MKNVIDVMINGSKASVFEDSIERLRDAGFEVETITYDDSDCLTSIAHENMRKDEAERWEKEIPSNHVSIMEKIKDVVSFFTEMPEMYGYVLGVFATLSSIIAIIINYNFYGKLYERRHKK